MKIAVINNFDSFVFNLVRYLTEEGCDVEVFRNDQVSFSSLESTDGILLSPGPGIPSEAGALKKVIAHFVETKPMLGVCLGHQAIAEHFGYSLELAEQPIHGKASLARQVVASPLFDGVPESFNVGRYHSWVVEQPLHGVLKETVRTADEIMAFEHEKLPIYGVQFHPESILTPDGRTIIRNWIQTVQNSKTTTS